jgi:hypothetical protein
MRCLDIDEKCGGTLMLRVYPTITRQMVTLYSLLNATDLAPFAGILVPLQAARLDPSRLARSTIGLSKLPLGK